VSGVPPSVWVLIAAFDAEPYVGQAIRSALAQDYPADRLHVVVVDDGSRDGTAAVAEALAAEHPDRVTFVRQENRGSVGATNRAAAEVPGDAEYIAILDADDAWPADKIAAQVEVLEARPEVGLVYTDMRVIDGAGAVLQESWLQGERPPMGGGLPTFLRENLVTGSSIVVRAALREVLFPIPDDMAWADWWLAARVAQFAEIAYLPLPRTLYRFHGTNMSLGAQGPAKLRELRKGLRLQRWFLRRVEAAAVEVADLELLWDGFERVAREALEVAGTPFAELVTVSGGDRFEAVELVVRSSSLLASGDVHGALAAAVRGAAADPGSDAARAALIAVRAVVVDGVGAQPLRGARGRVVCLEAGEVVRDPAVLGACAAALADVPDLTLAIDASSFDPAEAAAQIEALAVELGLASDERVDLALVTGPLDELGYGRLRVGTTARLATRRVDDGVPWFAPGDEGALRAWLVDGAAAQGGASS
jgi:hypothetical protein